MLKITRITAALSAAAMSISAIVCLNSHGAWARGGGGHGGHGGGRVSVNGYFRSNGTYVSQYTRSAPGSSTGSTYGGSSYESNYGSSSDPDFFHMYMKSGYEATQQKNYNSALFWFETALEERPANPYAIKAVQNVKSYIKREQAAK